MARYARGDAPVRRKSFVLLGHPVRHSASAPMFTAAFRAGGFPHVYTPVDVQRPEDLGRAIRLLKDGLHDGANVTLPYKRAVLEHVDEVDESAKAVGAANLLVVDEREKVVAHNTDVSALEAELGELVPGRSRVAILGAGGGAAAAIVACKRLRFAVVGVTTRSWGDTEATFSAESARRVRALGGLVSVWPSEERTIETTKLSLAMRLQWAELAEQADLVVQATSAGMLHGPDGETLGHMVPFERMPKTAVAYDLVYRPAETPFLRRAREHGLVAHSGLGMLVRQAEAAYRLWMGEDPEPGIMRRAADVVLASSIAS